ncbi:hypothetical protein N1851_034803 [Merluccius polli]|uniref:Gypsy retrotransposon integrase-like protein 1 n=1 Tax=Merluccius polli TaxID=89951 RepID=A0AA47LZ67_MERPO|nr:hypothetical protein N1851_034803 [Merluccius polli]
MASPPLVVLKQSKDALLAEDEPPWRTTLNLAGTPVSFKIDSGADTSVMSEATYETLRYKPKLSVLKNTLQSPGGVVATRGQFFAKIKAHISGQLRNCCFRVVVVKTTGENLLSRAVATKLGLIKRIDEISTSSGLGTLKGEPRLLIRLMKFNPVAEYVPGKHLVVADALSRQPMADTPPGDLETEVKAYVDSVEDDLRVRKLTIEQLKDQTKTDAELQCVLEYIHNGWPEHSKSVAVRANTYFKERGSLSEASGLLRRGKQIVIPEIMRENMLQKIHEGHQGLTKCRERYSGAVWWPGIASDVKKLALSYRARTENR